MTAGAATGAQCAGLPQQPFEVASVAVGTTLPIEHMTVAEKLRAMEVLWADLSRNADALDSPAWHEDVLREREKRVQEGKESYVDWETAKKELRERLL